jgi:glycosyltransferase involved in cell wall biosynthesis
MACGTPVIVTENTGSKAAVQKGGGLIIPAGDPSALEGAIKKFYHNRDMLIEYGKKAKTVAADYTWENYYRRLNQVINDIARNQG